MKKLNIDLELLMQSFSINEDDLGKEYLDTHTGDIINIPSEVTHVAEGNGEDNYLEEWQNELLKEAYAIKNDYEGRYIIIPTIQETFFNDIMMKFASEKVTSEGVKNELINALKSDDSQRKFKSILFQNDNELNKWHDYEEKKIKEYVVNWLVDKEIEILCTR